MKNSKPLPSKLTFTNKKTGKSLTFAKKPVYQKVKGSRIASANSKKA